MPIENFKKLNLIISYNYKKYFFAKKKEVYFLFKELSQIPDKNYNEKTIIFRLCKIIIWKGFTSQI